MFARVSYGWSDEYLYKLPYACSEITRFLIFVERSNTRINCKTHSGKLNPLGSAHQGEKLAGTGLSGRKNAGGANRIEAVAEQGLIPPRTGTGISLAPGSISRSAGWPGAGDIYFGRSRDWKISSSIAGVSTGNRRNGVPRPVGHRVSYGQSIAYLPVIDLVRELLSLEEAESVEKILAKIERGIRTIGEDLVWIVPFIRALLSLDPGDPKVVNMIPIQRPDPPHP